MIISAYVGVAGLADMGYQFYTTAEASIATRITAGIADAGNGWYSADATIPSNAASVRWNSTGTPTAIAREYFNPIEAASFVTVNTKLDTIDDFLDTEIAAIQTKVNALPTDPADASDIAASFATVNTKLDSHTTSFTGVNTKLDTIDDFVDTEVGAIKAVTDKLDTALVLDGAVYQYTANALELAPTGGGGGGTDPWLTLLPGSYSTGTAGAILGNYLDVAVSTRSTYTGTDTPGTTDLLTRIPSPITVTSGKVDVNDKTGFSLTSAYDAAKTASSQASNDLIRIATDKINTAMELDGSVWRYTANALETAPGGGGGSGDAMQSTLLQVKAKTDNLPIDPADASDIALSFTVVNGKLAEISSYVDTEIGAIKAKTDNLPADPADASDIATAFSSMGAQLTAIDDYVDTEISAIKAKTDQMTFTGGKIDANTPEVIIPTIDLNAMADAFLKRDWNSVTGEAQYSALNAFRMLRNAWNTAGGTLTVKKENGTTDAWQRSLSTDPAAQPITAAT